jgi:hypothetical protein
MKKLNLGSLEELRIVNANEIIEMALKNIYKRFLEFVQRQNHKLPCWWILGHKWPANWTITRGWRSGIKWELHLERTCTKCKLTQNKEWTSGWDHDIDSSV